MGFAEALGGDEEFVKKASTYFGGTMMEARRLMMPDVGDDDDGEGDGDDDEPEGSSADEVDKTGAA